MNKEISIKLIIYILLGIFSISAAILVYIPTQKIGIGISPDSIQYIGTARNLITGNGFTTYNHTPLILYPPVYPLLLALFGWISSSDPLLVANGINAVMFGFIVFLSGKLISKLTNQSIVFTFFCCLIITFSIPLYQVTTMAWSETLFILLVILFFYLLRHYSMRPNRFSLVLLAIISAFASLTRYIGIILIVIGITSLLLNSQKEKQGKYLHILIFTCIAAFPFGIWFIRNYLLSGTLSGVRIPSEYTFAQNLHAISVTFRDWYLSYSFFRNIFSISISNRIIYTFTVVLFGLTIFLCFKKKIDLKKLFSPLIIVLCAFSILHVVFLLAMSKFGFWQLIDSRYLAPLFIPLTIVVLWYLYSITTLITKNWAKQTGLIVLSISITVLNLYPVYTTIRNTENLVKFRIGFTPSALFYSDTIKFVKSHPNVIDGCKVYTNDPITVDFIGHIPVETSPAKTSSDLTALVVDDISHVSDSFFSKKTCLIWFNVDQVDGLYSISDLQKIADLKVLYSLIDGTIYTISKK